MFAKLFALGLAATSVVAENVPGYGGYRVVWQENFWGNSGNGVNEGNWNIFQGRNNANNEQQTYTRSQQNLQISGGGTVQLVPQNNNGQWSSARLESKYVFTPADGRRTILEAKIRFGNNPADQKQGIWPAFWMLGDSIRHGTPWPQCGEVDILEMVNGALTGYGTVHCDVAPGGICNEFSGIGSPISMGDNGWHTWRVIVDRGPDWTGESITWFKDNQQFHQITGGRIGNQNVWNSLATTPQYFILNVAVGGDWPGLPNGNTRGGWGSEMEVAYVAHYEST